MAPSRAQMIGPALERLAGLRAQFDARTARTLEAERRKRQADDAESVEAYRKSTVPRLAEAKDAAKAKAEQASLPLVFDQIRYESQVQAMAGPARDKPAAELLRVNNELAAIDKQRAADEADAVKRIQADVDRFKHEKEAATKAALASHEAALNQQAADSIEAYQHRVASELDALKTLGSSAPLHPEAVAGLDLPSPAAVAASATAQSATTGSEPLRRPVAALQAQRDRLVAVIREDVRRRVAGIAARRRWRISERRGVGSDASELIGNELRVQYATERALP